MCAVFSGRLLRSLGYGVIVLSLLYVSVPQHAHAFGQYTYSRQQVLVALFSRLSYEAQIGKEPSYTARQAINPFYISPRVRITPRRGFNLSVADAPTFHSHASSVESLSNLSPASGTTFELSDDDLIGPKLNIAVQTQPNTKRVGLEAVSPISEKWNLALAGLHQTTQPLDPSKSAEKSNIVQLGLRYEY